MDRAVYQLDAKLRNPASFFEDPAPKLIVEKMDFPRYADSDTRVRAGNRQSARSQVRRIRYLLRNLQDSLARELVDARTPVQGTIDRPDRDVSQFRDQVDSASAFLHPLNHEHSHAPNILAYRKSHALNPVRRP